MHKMLEMLEREIHEIVNNGLSTSNIDRAYKLVDMYDNLKDACYKETKERMMREGSSEVMTNAEGDNLYNDYIESKKAYRYSPTSECKRKLMNSLDDYMDSFARHMETMLNDAECADERDTINRYLKKIKSF